MFLIIRRTLDLPWIEIDQITALRDIGRIRDTNVHPTRLDSPFCVLFIVISGSRTIRFLGRKYQINEGEFCFLPSNIPHYGADIDPHDAYFIHIFAKTSLTKRPPDIQVDRLILPLVGGCSRDVDALRFIDYIHCQYVMPYCTESFLLSQIQALLYQLSLYSQRRIVWDLDPRSVIAEKVMWYIQNNMTTGLTHADYEQEFDLSYKYLNTCFSQRFGTTIKQAQINMRIEHAKTLLAGGYTIKETAYMCGFSDYHYFLKCFHTIVGTTPDQYIKRMLQRLNPGDPGGSVST